MFLNIRGVFDSVGLTILWDCLVNEGVQAKFINIMKSLHAYTTGGVRANCQLPSTFIFQEDCFSSLFPVQLSSRQTSKKCTVYFRNGWLSIATEWTSVGTEVHQWYSTTGCNPISVQQLFSRYL